MYVCIAVVCSNVLLIGRNAWEKNGGHWFTNCVIVYTVEDQGSK